MTDPTPDPVPGTPVRSSEELPDTPRDAVPSPRKLSRREALLRGAGLLAGVVAFPHGALAATTGTRPSVETGGVLSPLEPTRGAGAAGGPGPSAAARELLKRIIPSSGEEIPAVELGIQDDLWW